MERKLTNLTIKNYRSFGPNGVIIDMTSKVNFFIGKNNCGKSNIIKFLVLLGAIRDELKNGGLIGTGLKFNIDNHYNFEESTPIEFTIEQTINDADRKDFLTITQDRIYVTYQIFRSGDNYNIRTLKTFIDDLPESDIRNFEQALVSKQGGASGGTLEQAKERVNNVLNITKRIVFPKIEYLEEFRKITENKQLIEKLNSIVNPDYTRQKEIQKKKILCSYFQLVFGYEIDIKIPSVSNQEPWIELVIDDKQKPLSLLGAGLQQVLLIGMKIATTDAGIVCIDEPELYLHPRAQRALLSLVSEIKDKQFFFATHSNNFLDFEIEKFVYSVDKRNEESVIDRIKDGNDAIDIINDLGIRSSEIYQANGIIWVEGPSDRIFIKKWLEIKYPELKEGLQFTFLYYGGKILSHYSIKDESFEEYLNLLRLNRNCFIVMDSDKEFAYTIADLRDTKQRIIKECQEKNIGFWVSAGKEIENYITDRCLSEYSGDQITRNVYNPIKTYLTVFDSNKKVDFAREIAEKFIVDDFKGNLDLPEKIDSIASKIKEWNK